MALELNIFNAFKMTPNSSRKDQHCHFTKTAIQLHRGTAKKKMKFFLIICKKILARLYSK